jgi:hypothetical protein
MKASWHQPCLPGYANVAHSAEVSGDVAKRKLRKTFESRSPQVYPLRLIFCQPNFQRRSFYERDVATHTRPFERGSVLDLCKFRGSLLPY